jgi:ABC-2 type transport system permease protein
VTRQGIQAVARQEFMIRIRAGRWRWLLAAWFAAVALFTGFVHFVVHASEPGAANKGVVVYGTLTLFVLGLSLLVVPMLSAQSVNGDRDRGTLATLQVTLLTAGDIAVGKLLAAWGTGLVFLGLTLPLDLYAMTLGGVPLTRVLVVTLAVGLLLGTVAAVALCLSTLVARTTTSGALAYLAVFALTAGTGIAFALGAAATTETVQTSDGSYDQSRPDRVWWLLAPNPFVIVADIAPQLPGESPAEKRQRLLDEQNGRTRSDLRGSDPLGSIGRQVRHLRDKPVAFGQVVATLDPTTTKVGAEGRKAVWPLGLAVDVLLGAGATWLTARRLRTPTRALPRGQRVA